MTKTKKKDNGNDIVEKQAGAAEIAAAAAAFRSKRNSSDTVEKKVVTDEHKAAAFGPKIDAVDTVEKKMVTDEQEIIGESKETVADPSKELLPKETKKRVRRAGKTPTRKIAKIGEGALPKDTNAYLEVNGTLDSEIGDGLKSPAATVNSQNIAQSDKNESVTPNQRVLSKHDEKWNGMFGKLLEYKEKNNNTLVPQCYPQDPRLGRWVHYQRVEFWIFQQCGVAKITEDRIERLDAIGFEWDPQKAQWEKMFEKLKAYKNEHHHCKVPKGYTKDLELANWVRNQRLEQANLSKEGKKSRMTPERYKLLSDLGFKWSLPSRKSDRKGKKKGNKKQEAIQSEKIADEGIETKNAQEETATAVTCNSTAAYAVSKEDTKQGNTETSKPEKSNEDDITDNEQIEV